MRESKSQTWQSNEANEDPKARDILTFLLALKELYLLGTQPLSDLKEIFHSFLFICFTQKKLTPKEKKVKAK